MFFDGVENSVLQLTKQAVVQRITACAATEAPGYLILSITTTPPNAPEVAARVEWIESKIQWVGLSDLPQPHSSESTTDRRGLASIWINDGIVGGSQPFPARNGPVRHHDTARRQSEDSRMPAAPLLPPLSHAPCAR